MRICDMLDRAGAIDDQGTDEMEEEKERSRFRSSYISALPWLPQDQDHIIWWRQEETDQILRTTTSTPNDEPNNDITTTIDEALRIRSEVSSAIPLLADILGPIVRSKLSTVPPNDVRTLLGFGSGNGGPEIDTDLASSILLSSYLRGAFVILMTRSFDSTFDGSAPSSRGDGGGGRSEDGGRLVPVLDMVQHTTGTPNVYHVYDRDSDSITVHAARDLTAGEELVISYYDGGMDAGVFGARFGFVPGERRSFRVLLEERSEALFNRPDVR